jgi:hypothetical protein
VLRFAAQENLLNFAARLVGQPKRLAEITSESFG